MNLLAAPEGAGRYDKPHGDEGQIDLEPHMAQALTDVVEVILAFGQYPQPRQMQPSRLAYCLAPRRIEFDLREWVNEHIDPGEMAELYVSMLTDFSLEHDTRRHAETSRVEAMLREELRDSNIVRDRAEKLAEEEKEAA